MDFFQLMQSVPEDRAKAVWREMPAERKDAFREYVRALRKKYPGFAALTGISRRAVGHEEVRVVLCMRLGGGERVAKDVHSVMKELADQDRKR